MRTQEEIFLHVPFARKHPLYPFMFKTEMKVGSLKASVIWSIEPGGWEHVSIMPLDHRRMPSWDDMCKLKEIFFEDEEEVIQIHPKKSEYVNIVDNCLHLWRHPKMPLPKF